MEVRFIRFYSEILHAALRLSRTHTVNHANQTRTHRWKQKQSESVVSLEYSPYFSIYWKSGHSEFDLWFPLGKPPGLSE